MMPSTHDNGGHTLNEDNQAEAEASRLTDTKPSHTFLPPTLSSSSSHESSTTHSLSSTDSLSAQRTSQSGPIRHRPGPLNIHSSSSGSSGGPGTPILAPSPGGYSLNSPYAGSYAQRQETRASGFKEQKEEMSGREAGSRQNSLQYPTRYPGEVQGRTEDGESRASSEVPQRPATLNHSASLPVLPSQDPGVFRTQGHLGSHSSYPTMPTLYHNRSYNYGYPGSDGQSYNPPPTYPINPTSSMMNSTHAPPPPPFSHAYSSPALPMYPSQGHHYLHGHYPHATPYHPYALQSPSYTPGVPVGGPYGTALPGNPGVLMLGANGQYMPHNPSSIGSGRGTPLSERPFKCDECVQSFNRNHDLKRHKRIHLAVKPFACEKCGKQFSRKDALRRHWLVKGCKTSDDPDVNMANPAFQPNPPLSPITPDNPNPPSLASQMSSGGPIISPGSVTVPTYAQNTPMGRTPSYGGGPMVVTPDDEAYGNTGYMAYNQTKSANLNHSYVPSAATSPTAPNKSGTEFMYGQAGTSQQGYNQGIVQDGQGFPGHLQSTNGIASSADMKLPGRFSLDARLHNENEREIVGPRSASLSMPIVSSARQPVMVVQPDGMIEENIPGQQGVVKRMSRDGYFEGVFVPNASGELEQAIDAYSTVNGPSGQKPTEIKARMGSPMFAVPFDKVGKPGMEGPADPSSEAWSRWHRPSFPFPVPGHTNVYRAPDSMEDSNDLRKSISRASISQAAGTNQQPMQQGQQRWTRSSFPFPENPNNSMGIPNQPTKAM